jgi:predicted RND superfamily exporter protein/polyhydroxyalkanoate synthesis regulator phasin
MNALFLKFVGTIFHKVLARHYLLVTLISVILTVLSVWVIANKWNINSDFKALLPETSAAALAMTEVGDRVGSGSALFVVVDSPDTEANKKFAAVLSAKLQEIPSVALAHFHNDKVFFEKNQLLYMQAEDITTLYDRLAKKIRQAKKEANPLFVSLKKTKSNPDELIETDDIADKYKAQAQNDYKEYLIADDGYSLTIVVRFVESSTDLVATNALLDNVRKLAKDLKPESYQADMTVELGGGLVKRQAEYKSILSDVVTSAFFTIFGLCLVLGLYFRRFRAIVIVLTPLIMGIVWTLALAFTLYGELTTVTVFIFAILLGLGIDFAIHLLSGYDHARLEGKSPVEALVECFSSTGKATVLGALTTFITFVVLSFAQFRGLSQFGTVAAMGVVASLTAMILVLPALVLTFQHIRPYQPNTSDDQQSFLTNLITDSFISKWSKFALVGGLILTVLASFEFHNVQFEENFRKIGKIQPFWISDADVVRDEQEVLTGKMARKAAKVVMLSAQATREAIQPATFIKDREQKDVGDKYTSAVSGKQSSTPTIMLFDNAESAEKVYDVMKDMFDKGELTTIASLASVYAFLPASPEEQAVRMVEIEKIRTLLDKEGTAFLSDKQVEKVNELRERLDVKPITTKELPEWSKHLFKEAGAKAKPPAPGEPYAYEYLIYINESIDQMKGGEARRFLKEVAEVRQKTGVDVRIGSQSYIYVAMLDEIKTDGARMMLIAILFVFLILSVGFKSPFRSLVSMIPLTMGTMWAFGFMAWFGIKLDFFNVIIIPVVVGIGVDDGVHFYHHYLHEGRGSIASVFRKVGSAVVMTSVTSIIGFGGLAVTSHRGLQSIGYVAITGIVFTLLSTLLLMPSLLWLAEKMNLTWVIAKVGGDGAIDH